MMSGIPKENPYTVNQVCGSGIRSVASDSSINSGDSKILVAGGQESTLAPHAIYLRDGKLGDVELIDTMIKDGLWDPYIWE